jgi:glycerol-3-phosphate dehydrogenase (NAD(P)+)
VSARADVVGIVGAGTFGTALGSVLARAGRRVVIWSRDLGVVEAIQKSRRSPRLPAAQLAAPLEATADPRKLAAEARFIVLAVSSKDVRERARELGDVIDGSHIVVHAIGALSLPAAPAVPVARTTKTDMVGQRVSEVMLAGLPTLKIGALAGPALPADMIESLYSSMVVASRFDEVVAEGRRLLNAPPVLRVYSSKDLVGVELASALSGAYTVALGLADGLATPAGTRAVLVTRAVAEASRLGQAAGAEPRTFAGLAGLGNLLVRANSDRSADYVLGRRMAEGIVTADAQRTEGARAALAAVDLAASLKVRMPVLQGIAGVLTGNLEPREAAKQIGDTVAVEE